MAAITEDYVSFEIAKILKEKGFDAPCLACWYIGSEEHEKFGDSPFNYNEVKSEFDWLSRPTLQMAMKWLREVHNIAIVVTPSMFWGKYNVSIYKKGSYYPIGFDGNSLIPSYEQACEAAIKYYVENLL